MNLSNIFLLLRIRRLALANQFLRPDREKIIRWTLILSLGILFLIGDYLFFERIIRYLDGLPFEIGEELIVQLLNVIFLTLFLMILFSSLIVSLSNFYFSQDLALQISMPVSIGSIVVTRFFQTVIHSSWMMFVFSLPIFVAYGSHFSAGGFYYPFIIFSLICLIVISCGLGAMGIVALMKYFPTRKIHQVLSFVGLFFLVGLVVYLRFLSPEKFFGRDVSDEMIISFVESLKVPEYWFLPTSWITRGMAAWINENLSMALLQLSYLFTAAVILFWIFFFISRRIYFPGWCMVQEITNAPFHARKSGGNRGIWFKKVTLPFLQRSLLAKDLKLFIRDPEQWSQLFILCALVLVYIFNIMNLPLDNLVLKNVVSVLNIGLVGFVLSALISRFVYIAPSLEGKNMWTIYTSPVGMKQFLWSKFWMFFPPLLMIAEFLVVVSNHLLQVDSYVMNVSVVGVFLITMGLVGLGLGLGSMYPVFDHENISEVSLGTGGVLFMILGLSFVGLTLMLVARPMVVHFNQTYLLKSVGGIEVPICYALILLLSLSVTFLPLNLGIRALKKMDM